LLFLLITTLYCYLCHQYSLYCLAYFEIYISLNLCSQALKQLYRLCHCTMLRYNFEPKSKQFVQSYYSPSITLNYTFTANNLPVTTNSKHILHCLKLLSLFQSFLMALRCAQLKHVVPNKAGASERSHKAIQKLLSPRRPRPSLAASLSILHALLAGRAVRTATCFLSLSWCLELSEMMYLVQYTLLT